MSKVMALAVAALAAIGLIAKSQEPEIRRYLKISSM
jgi:hypothetical protein